MRLIAVSVQSSVDSLFHAAIDCRGSTQVASSLGGNCLSQVACSAAAMHRFAFSRKPKKLLCDFVRFDLGLAFSLSHHSRPNGMSLNLYLRCIYEGGRIAEPPKLGKS